MNETARPHRGRENSRAPIMLLEGAGHQKPWPWLAIKMTWGACAWHKILCCAKAELHYLSNAHEMYVAKIVRDVESAIKPSNLCLLVRARHTR